MVAMEERRWVVAIIEEGGKREAIRQQRRQ
jgi:hypothetical protein